jgi:Bifunctional DNA primase/polymerase, N-terminal
MNESPPLPDVILDHLRRGHELIPLRWMKDDGKCSCGKPDCDEKSIAKHPMFRVWQKEASADLATVEGWRRQWPKCGFGWKMGRDYIALDLDRKDGRDGVTTLQALEAEHGSLGREWCARTPNDGRHLVLRNPNGTAFTASTNWRPGIDLRTGNSFICIEPTVTPKGTYQTLAIFPASRSAKSELSTSVTSPMTTV